MKNKRRVGGKLTRKVKGREFRLGNYYIVTDTEETEKNYFIGLRNSLPSEIQNSLAIHVINTGTKDLVNECKKLRNEDDTFRKIWIVFDRDEVKDFDKIIDDAQKSGFSVSWSNPCFEIWLYAYFGAMPVMSGSVQCCSDFERIFKKKTKAVYSKSDIKIYDKMLKYGDELKAINIAKKKYQQCISCEKSKPSFMNPCTKVHELVEEIIKYR